MTWDKSFRLQFSTQKCIERIEIALEEIYNLAQGGTAVGTGEIQEEILIKKLSKK